LAQPAATTVAVITLNEVWHVGELDGMPGRSGHSSYEGHHLSVSWCPRAWQIIARLSGPTWHLKRPGARFLDVLKLAAAERKAIIAWGIEQGLVAYRTRWQAVVSHDENGEEPLYSVFPLRRAAIDESVDPDEDPPKKITHLCATPKLLRRLSVSARSRNLGWDYLPIAWAEEHELDGVWWRETYDPDSLSAPRGCVLRNRFQLWTREKLADGRAPEDNRRFPPAKHIAI
jgi:hypothetical protein